MAYTEITMQEFAENQTHLADSYSESMNGVSPGSAAAQFGVSRYAVHKAIERGTLEAFRIIHPDGKLMAILIPQRAIDAYIHKHLRGTPSWIGTRKTA